MKNREPVFNDTIVSVHQLVRHFGPTLALDHVDLHVPRGKVLAIIGENGAGKTTLVKHILGLLRPQEGSVAIFGLDPVKWPEKVLAHIGCLSEEPDLPAWMTVAELMEFLEPFYPNWDRQYARELAGIFELNPAAKIRDLSRGQLARAGLMAALAHRPQLLVLDEPSSGLDPLVRQDILGSIIRTVTDDGRTVVFSSHLLGEVERVSDQLAIIDRGQVSVSGALEDVLAAHHRVQIHWQQVQEGHPILPGCLQIEGQGRDWDALCCGDWEEIQAKVQAANGQVVQRHSPSLNEIFVARAQALRTRREA